LVRKKEKMGTERQIGRRMVFDCLNLVSEGHSRMVLGQSKSAIISITSPSPSPPQNLLTLLFPSYSPFPLTPTLS